MSTNEIKANLLKDIGGQLLGAGDVLKAKRNRAGAKTMYRTGFRMIAMSEMLTPPTNLKVFRPNCTACS